MGIEIYYVSEVILQTVWPEGKGGGSVSLFVPNMTGTDKDRTEIDSWLLISFCCANSIVLDLL
jgi:hypothetical protein